MLISIPTQKPISYYSKQSFVWTVQALIATAAIDWNLANQFNLPFSLYFSHFFFTKFHPLSIMTSNSTHPVSRSVVRVSKRQWCVPVSQKTTCWISCFICFGCVLYTEHFSAEHDDCWRKFCPKKEDAKPLMINPVWVVATQIFFIFTPILGEDEPILTIIYFSIGWGKTTNQLWITNRPGDGDANRDEGNPPPSWWDANPTNQLIW